jgi:Fe2+ transport system protein FeoA
VNSNKNSEGSSNSWQTQNWQEFTFFCDTSKDKPNRNHCAPKDAVFSLSQCRVGDCVCIVELQVSESIHLLRDAGFIPGATVLVQSCTDTGSVIVVLQNKSLGFGADMAGNIFVKKLE